jgi:hypothetical protein
MYDQEEISELQEEYKDAIKKAFKKYSQNIEEIFDYGCTEECMKDSFIKECEEVLDCNVNEKKEERASIKRKRPKVVKESTTTEQVDKMTEVRCSDGDCIYQSDETCHKEEIVIDDHNRCISKKDEGS